MGAGVELVAVLELRQFAARDSLFLLLLLLLHDLRQAKGLHTLASRGGGLALAFGAHAAARAHELPAVAHDLEVGEELLLLEDLYLVLLLDDVAAVLLLIGEV